MTAAVWALALAGSVSAQTGSALFDPGESSRPAKPPASVKSVAPVAPVRAAAPRSPSRTRTVAKGKGSKKAVSKAASPVALNGRWQDSDCIPLTGVTHKPPLFVKRQYEFSDSRRAWALDAIVYTSDSCVINTRLLTYHGEGSYSVIGKSRLAGNAYDASFRMHAWRATPDTREGVLTLLNGRCGSGDFEAGRALDLSATGCPTLGIRSIAEKPDEVELVGVSNGQFFLGKRSFVPGMTDDRPAQLSSYGLVRIP